MHFRRFVALASGFVVVLAASAVCAQSLADVAKKEEERRKQAPSAGKVYTNKDLKSAPSPSTPPADPATVLDPGAAKDADAAAADKPAGDKPAADKAADPAADKAAADKAAAPKGPAQDQKYWKEKMGAARLALERDSGYADAMQTRVNALTTDFVNRDDPAQRSVIEQNRNKALAELDRLKKQIEDDKKAIADLEEEARRAGVPPGWLR